MTNTSQINNYLPLNTTDISQSELNINNRSRTNLFPWRGQFSPQFIEALLQRYASAPNHILDPFAGSGTVLHEAGRKRLSVTGSEINPAAYQLASVYKFINEPMPRRSSAIVEVERVLNDVGADNGSLFREVGDVETSDRIKKVLSNVGLVEELPKNLLDALVILLDFYQPLLTVQRLWAVWAKLKRLVFGLPYSSKPISMLNCDARALPIPPDTVDLVITSPPYINVFNYHQQYRASAEALGWDLLHVAKSEIGSNRKHRGNRFLTVIQYCLDLAQVLQRLVTFCTSNARIIFVVGRESQVRGVAFYNGQIVTEVAINAVGLRLEMRQERVFKNKFGNLIYEDILHFTNAQSCDDSMLLDRARSVAQIALKLKLSNTSDLNREDLEAALERVSEVQPSPIYSAPTEERIATGKCQFQHPTSKS